ncbi:hypothetical protein [Mucilaginibacter sp. FT3.2]|uniref:hypothetical protein n=1 Tax=Mucilaginibacter sp. FT3.2 TaxID=2723090 RepID=UPI0017B78A78|nr:hypothetical protein [Mucilaginibacter sp. FT3.2]MBB6230449.1 hypothetical protein [Mucilaginibacter sp. FT3.2]
MKKWILLGLLCFFTMGNVFAQTQDNADSAAYQLQRKKINTMLAARKEKFGQYDQSLSQHTGIFGFQTKDDIRRSNSILMDIAKTDDAIFKELKILFEYSAFQQRQSQSHSKEAEEINHNFLLTISKLKQQNAQLKADAGKTNTLQPVYITIIVLMLASILYLIYKKNKV